MRLNERGYFLRNMRRWLMCFMMVAFATVLSAAPDAPGEFRLRLGPIFEVNVNNSRLTKLAIRPLWAWEESTFDQRDKDMEILWPLSHFGWRRPAYHWRVLMTFWHEEDWTETRSRDYSLAIPPFWFHGRDEGKNYAGLFPIYGRMPKVFFVEDAQWAMFPFWLRYRTGGSQAIWRDYFLFPFFSLKYDDDKTRWSLWPIYGTKKEKDFKSFYLLWPIWNSYYFTAENHKGIGYMLWPLVEQVYTNSEKTFGLLPPLFRYTYTSSGAYNLRFPWPFFEYYGDTKESTWKCWRFWGMTHRGTRDGWWLLYPLLLKERQKTVNLYTRKFRFWPFYTNEVNFGYDIEGKPHLQTSYFRIWPFYASSYNEREGLRRKTFVLFPIRDVPAIERNWAPFWTFYSARQLPGSDEILHELFWGLIWWRTYPDPNDVELPEEVD